MAQIVLIGGGGHCKSVIDVIEQEGEFLKLQALLINQNYLDLVF